MLLLFSACVTCRFTQHFPNLVFNIDWLYIFYVDVPSLMIDRLDTNMCHVFITAVSVDFYNIQQQVLPSIIWKCRVSKSPLVTMGRPKFNPKTAPSPSTIITRTNTSILDRPHSPSQMAPGYTQPFCHNTLWTDRLTDRRFRQMFCHISRLRSPVIKSDAAKNETNVVARNFSREI